MQEEGIVNLSDSSADSGGEAHFREVRLSEPCATNPLPSSSRLAQNRGLCILTASQADDGGCYGTLDT